MTAPCHSDAACLASDMITECVRQTVFVWCWQLCSGITRLGRRRQVRAGTSANPGLFPLCTSPARQVEATATSLLGRGESQPIAQGTWSYKTLPGSDGFTKNQLNSLNTHLLRSCFVPWKYVWCQEEEGNEEEENYNGGSYWGHALCDVLWFIDESTLNYLSNTVHKVLITPYYR